MKGRDEKELVSCHPTTCDPGGKLRRSLASPSLSESQEILSSLSPPAAGPKEGRLRERAPASELSRCSGHLPSPKEGSWGGFALHGRLTSQKPLATQADVGMHGLTFLMLG